MRSKIIFWIICLLAFLWAQPSTVEFSGDWNGALKLNGGVLRIVFHIQENNNTIMATMDSPDQNAFGIQVSSVKTDGQNIEMTVDAVHGNYKGVLDFKAQTISGTWSQGGQSFPLNLKKTTETPPQPVYSAEQQGQIGGNWIGTLKIHGIDLRLVFRISFDDQGHVLALMDSPDQGAKDIPVTAIDWDDSSGKWKFTVGSIGGAYKGKLRDGVLKGVWMQGGQSLPVDLTKSEKAPEINRPQEPKKPYPYKEEGVRFKNERAEIELAGTLTYPEKGGPFAAVALITGSGPQNRDEELLGHKPFMVLADYLTRHGFAVLRYDDRGFGESGGKFSEATSRDFAQDALAAVEFLKSSPVIDPQKIGLIGHSEGGLIAPMVAVKSNDIAFIVLLAGPGVPGTEILLRQTFLISKANGASDRFVNKELAAMKNVFDLIRNEKNDDQLKEKLKDAFSGYYTGLTVSEKKEFENDGTYVQQLNGLQKTYLSPWFKYFLFYDPQPVLEKVHCPVLAVNGSKDLQVDPEQNLYKIKEALQAGGNKQFTVHEFPGLNHLFQHAESGSPSEYAKIEETFSEEAMRYIADWMEKITTAM